MNKQEFILQLRKGLQGLPREDIDERLDFYSEMIDDRIEEGLSEEDAVGEIGSVDSIISQIVSEVPITKLVKEKITPKKKLKAWEIVLLVLGSPLWISLVATAIVVVASLYLCLWSVIFSLWSAFSSLIGCGVGGIVSGIVFAFNNNILSGFAMIGAGFICTGLSIFMFYGCKGATKGILSLTKKIGLGIKNCFIKKGEA